MCSSRLPAALLDEMKVAIKGATVINPRRWWILSMCERLSNRA